MCSLMLFIGGYAQAQLCIPVYMGGCTGMGPGGASGMGIDINDLHINGDASTAINELSTSCSGGSPTGWHVDTSLSVTVHPGGTYTVTVNSDVPGGNIQAFVDFDNNGSFSAVESVGGINGVSSSSSLTTFTISIPATAATGIHYFRFNISPDLFYPSLNGCPVPITTTMPPMSNGETHDYKINVTSASTTCAAPTGLTGSSITSSSATISWTAVTSALGYEYVVNTTSADPSGSGTFTSSTSTSPGTLTAATTYYAHIRTKCSSTSFSAWATYTFTTLSAAGCGAVTGLTASGVTNTAATVSWTAVSGSLGYEYIVNTTAAAPSGSGAAVTTTSINPTGLTPSTVYYAHVRDSCSATSLSAWVTISFTTTATAPTCSPVAGLASSGVTSHGATIAWTAATGNAGYKYVINSTATDPTVPGTFTPLNSTPVTGLTPATTYYAHLRDSCSAGNVSVWTTISFTTLSASEVANVAAIHGNVIAYPNPVKDIVTVRVNDGVSGTAVVQLADISGRVWKVVPMDDRTIGIDMSDLPAGTYIIKYTDAQRAETIKINK